METVRLGRTGLEVSRLCLGCMSYGEPQRGNHAWTLSEEHSRGHRGLVVEQIRQSAGCSVIHF